MGEMKKMSYPFQTDLQHVPDTPLPVRNSRWKTALLATGIALLLLVRIALNAGMIAAPVLLMQELSLRQAESQTPEAPALLPYMQGQQYGFMDLQGKVVIAPQFEDACSFADNGLAAVQIGEQWGYINTAGQIVIAPRFELANDFYNGLAAVMQDQKWGYINEQGNFEISPVFYWCFSFYDKDFAWVEEDFENGGIINRAGQYITPPPLSITDNIWSVFLEDDIALYPLYKDGLYGYIDGYGNSILSPRYDFALPCAPGQLAIVKRDDRCGFIDDTGREVIAPRYMNARSFADNGLAAVQNGNKWGYLNTEGVWVIAPQFEDAGSFADNGLAAVQVDEQWGYIDETGEQVIEPQFEDAGSFADNGLAAVLQDGKWGYVDQRGRMVIAPRFDTAAGFDQNNDISLARVSVAGRYGYIRSDGTYLVEPDYGEADLYSAGYISVVEDDKTISVYNLQGNKLIDHAPAAGEDKQEYYCKYPGCFESNSYDSDYCEQHAS